MRKPIWLDKKINLSYSRELKSLLRRLGIHTVCEEASCPNLSECFSRGVATFMILGVSCTRNCRFCGVKKGNPKELDFDEPTKIREAVKKLNLEYVVITSPTRDDLDDGGASLFFLTVKELRALECVKKVEVLIPDFWARPELIEKVLGAGPNVVSHNLETVPSIYPKVRDKADYNRSLEVLKLVKKINPNIFTKSGIMLGLGEEEGEVQRVLEDLVGAGCDFLSIGQYLAPSRHHWPTKFLPPDKFKEWENFALRLGFKSVKSFPYARSSYLAHTYFE
jgi:lipoic acid synthetase